MAYGTLLPSARDQWLQWTYAVLPNGNWDAGGQHICILDNGDIWMHMERVMSFFSYYPFEPDFGDLGETEFTWIGKVHPLGNERVSGDEMVYGAEPASVPNSFGYPYPKITDTYLPDSAFTYRGNIAAHGLMVTDGTMLYLFQAQFDSSGLRGGWYKIDPNTYEFEFIAGSAASGPFVDAPVGTDAVIWDVGQAVFHDGFIYWVEMYPGLIDGVSTPARKTVRRMSITPPYPVETVTPDFNVPAGWPGILGSSAWFDQINPATGMQNIFNDDILPLAGSSTAILGFGIWDGHMYFAAETFASAHAYYYIKRCPLEGGPLELLFYGIGYRDVSNAVNTHRDMQNDSAEFPNGLKHQTLNIWYESNHYTPDLEGLEPLFTSILIDPEGFLYAQNLAGGRFQSGGNEWGTRIIRFSLPDLVADYEASGPQRINRENPQWDTLNNGTTFWEASNTGKQPGVFQGGIPLDWPRRRHWSGRDGYVPLISHVLVTGWALNWNAPQWEGKIVFVHPEISESVGALSYTSTATNNAMMVAVLEPGGGEMELRLNFEGIALKGYGAAPGMPAAYAPEIVTLQ